MNPANIAVVLADLVPQDKIIDFMDEAIQKYKKDPTPENLGHVSSMCSMFLTKSLIEQDGRDALLKRMDELHLGADMFSEHKKN